MSFIKKAIEFDNEINDFCNSHQQIYIYGAGYYGKLCLHFLQKKGISIEGFITTEGGGDIQAFSVYKAEEIFDKIQLHDGIILAVNKKNQKEIKENYRFSCDILIVSDEEIRYVQNFLYSEIIPSEDKYPVKKELVSLHWNNILVIQLEVTYGDMMWSTAFFRELRRNFPQSNIVLIMNPKLQNLYRNCPYIDEIVLYECETLFLGLSEEMENKANEFMKKNFADISFDVVFLPKLLPVYFDGSQGCWENILLAFASGAKNRIAHAMYVSDFEKYMCDRLSKLFSVIAKHTNGRHEVLQKLELLQVCGCQYTDDKMEIWLDDQDRRYASSFLSQFSDNILLIAVAMVASSKSRSWNPSKFGNVFRDITQKYNNVKFLLCGGTDASEAVAELTKEQKMNCIDITGKTTLTEVAAIISHCDIYLGVDTGLMHMASTYGIPVIEISASNMSSPGYWIASPVRSGPWKTDSIVLRPEKGLEDCQYFCSKNYSHCINQITEELVESALEEMISRREN